MAGRAGAVRTSMREFLPSGSRQSGGRGTGESGRVPGRADDVSSVGPRATRVSLQGVFSTPEVCARKECGIFGGFFCSVEDAVCCVVATMKVAKAVCVLTHEADTAVCFHHGVCKQEKISPLFLCK